jgi:hypothetical protein
MALAYFERVRQATSWQAKEQQADLLADEAAAWLGSTVEQPVRKARERLEMSSVFNAKRLVIESSLAFASGRAAEWMAEYEQQGPECLTVEGQSHTCPLFVVRVYQGLGDHERARAEIENRLEKSQLWRDEWPSARRSPNFATLLAMLGREEEALDVFEELVQSGWRSDFIWGPLGLQFLLQRDITFDAIRDHPRFQAIVTMIEADMAEQLENVREMERNGEIPTLDELRAALAE